VRTGLTVQDDYDALYELELTWEQIFLEEVAVREAA
jgi:hypothetical protein